MGDDLVPLRRIVSPDATPTPLLDPSALRAARLAYDDAVDVLRARARAGLRPSTCHRMAYRILRLTIFGERDQRLLKERALAHFL